MCFTWQHLQQLLLDLLAPATPAAADDVIQKLLFAGC
jgi:hypothetical protein